MGFERVKCLYVKEENFGELYSACQRRLKGDFFIQEAYLVKGTRLCIARCELLITEVRTGLLASHYGENKTFTAC